MPESLPKLNSVEEISTNDFKSLETAFKCVTEPLEERLDRIEESIKSISVKKGAKNES